MLRSCSTPALPVPEKKQYVHERNNITAVVHSIVAMRLGYFCDIHKPFLHRKYDNLDNLLKLTSNVVTYYPGSV